MQGFLTEAVRFIFPAWCLGCGAVGEYICRKCRARLLDPSPQLCHVCGQESRSGTVHRDCFESTHLDGVVRVGNYDGAIKAAVIQMKYGFHYAFAAPLGELLAERIIRSGGRLSDCALTFVPATRFRRYWRGFNQSELMSRRAAGVLGVPILPLLTRRNSRQGSQVGLGREDRMSGMFNSFRSVASTPKKVILIDDVMTTGATLESCARALRQGGAESVYAVVLARGY